MVIARLRRSPGAPQDYNLAGPWAPLAEDLRPWTYPCRAGTNYYRRSAAQGVNIHPRWIVALCPRSQLKNLLERADKKTGYKKADPGLVAPL